MKVSELLSLLKENEMFKPTTRLELIRQLQTKQFNVLHVEEGKAKDIADSIKAMANKEVTVIVLS